MPVYTDQTGRSITLPDTPRRIISLVPSLTELLADLGLHDEVAGITKFCIHPGEWFRTKTRIGGTKQLKMDIIHLLQPDLIIANKEENVKEQVEELARQYPVYVSNVNNLPDALHAIEQIGIMTGRQEAASAIAYLIKKNFNSDTRSFKPKTCYLIWRNPYMTIGGDTFIHSMLELGGFDNVFSNSTRYPEVTVEQIKASGCEILLLSSEPFPFKEKHADELREQLPGVRIVLADGEMFSWYGSRLIHAASYIREIQQWALQANDR